MNQNGNKKDNASTKRHEKCPINKGLPTRYTRAGRSTGTDNHCPSTSIPPSSSTFTSPELLVHWAFNPTWNSEIATPNIFNRVVCLESSVSPSWQTTYPSSPSVSSSITFPLMSLVGTPSLRNSGSIVWLMGSSSFVGISPAREYTKPLGMVNERVATVPARAKSAGRKVSKYAVTSSGVREVNSSPTAPVKYGVSLCVFGAASDSGLWPRATAMTLVLPKKRL